VTEIDKLKALLRKSLSTIRELNQEVAARDAAGTDAHGTGPVAVIGAACELPGGAGSPEEYWSLLLSGKDCVRDAPASPWLREVYSRYFRRRPEARAHARAGYLDGDVMRFDPRRFAISPTEARDMDPTQRMALKLTVQALERAGYDPYRVDGRVGVYFGVIGGEYGALGRSLGAPGRHLATGMLNSVVSGRISHTFGFDGPTMSVDTACSSSLVALHLAAEAIRAGDCDVAVVGGVNLLIDPSVFTVLSGVGALSADGRCHSFCGGGDGYGRGEGGGVVVLKRLAAAQRDRDQVLSVIRATGVNHDGTCSGLTVPNGRAQRGLIESTLRKAGLSGADVDYLEAHGTGTPLGDPIELAAASDAFCRDRPARRPLVVGSAKAQIGHLEAAAGIVSLIKLMLVLRHGEAPAQVLHGPVNQNIDFEDLRLHVPTSRLALRAEGRPLTGAVSSFGFSGTNAHAILSLPADEPTATTAPIPLPRKQALLLSGRSTAALDACAADLTEHLGATGTARAEDVGFTRAVGREHGPFRGYVTGVDRDDLVTALQTYRQTSQFVTESQLARTGPPKLAILLDGSAPLAFDARAAAWHREFPGFREGFDSVARAWSARGGEPLDRLLEAGVRRDDALELASFHVATLCGTVGMLRGFGIRPEIWYADGIAVLAVAVETGALTTEAALTELSRLLASTRGGVPAPDARGLPVPAGDPRRGGSGRVGAAIICPRDGGFVGSRQLSDPEYWLHAATARPDLEAVTALCAEHGVRIALAAGSGTDAPAASDRPVEVIGFGPGEDAHEALLSVLLRLYELGADLDWRALYAGSPVRRVLLPTTPMDEAPYAFEQTDDQPLLPARDDVLEPAVHLSPGAADEFAFVLDATSLPLADTHHIVHVGYFIEMLLRAAALSRPDTEFDIEQMRFSTALIVAGEPVSLRLTFTDVHGTEPEFAFHSLVDATNNRWQLHVSGRLTQRKTPPDPGTRSAITTPLMSGATFYAGMEERGMRLGPSVRAVETVYRDGDDVLADVDPAFPAAPEQAFAGVAPGVFDGAAQLFHAVMPDAVPRTAAFMVETLNSLVIHPGARATPARLRLDEVRPQPDGASVHGRLTVLDVKARVIVEFSCVVRRINGGIAAVLAAAAPPAEDLRLDPAAITNTDSLIEALRSVVSVLTGTATEHIRAGDTTTNLGVDSLLASRLHHAIEPVNRRGQVELKDIVQGISIAQLADALTSVGKPASTPARRRGYLSLRPGKPRLRLLCLPYGGGSTLLFQGWQKQFPDDVEVCPVALPGRGDRIADLLIPDVHQLVDELVKEVEAASDVPFHLYGHSAGALIAFVLAMRLRKRGNTALRRLSVGAFSSPGGGGNPFYLDCLRELRAAGHDEIPRTDQIRALGPTELADLAAIFRFPPIDDPKLDFTRLTLPILAGDIRLVGSFQQGDAAVLDVPITAIHGRDDDRVGEREMRDWERWTSAGFDFHLLDGDHFFLHADQHRDLTLDILRDHLS
jgi:acyl transferase domain-containing protein/surfactin synthase thioesterase subunit